MADAHVEAVKTDLNAGGKGELPSNALEDLPTRLQKGFQEKLSYTNSLYQDYPLITTFIVVFAGLSAIPILTFCGTSIFILSTFLLFSTGFALCSALAIIFVSGLALLACLAFVLTTSLVVVGTATGTYLSVRLVFHVRSRLVVDGNGGGIVNAILDGTKNWIAEIKEGLLQEIQFFSGTGPLSRHSAELRGANDTSPTEEDFKLEGKEQQI